MSGATGIPILGREYSYDECVGVSCKVCSGSGGMCVCHIVSLVLSSPVGTFKLRDQQTISAVIDAALSGGYRLIGMISCS